MGNILRSGRADKSAVDTVNRPLQMIYTLFEAVQMADTVKKQGRVAQITRGCLGDPTRFNVSLYTANWDNSSGLA